MNKLLTVLLPLILGSCGIGQEIAQEYNEPILNSYNFSAPWCGNCKKPDNISTFMLSENLQGEFVYDYAVRSVYETLHTYDVLVCTGTNNGVCTSIEVWAPNAQGELEVAYTYK